MTGPRVPEMRNGSGKKREIWASCWQDNGQVLSRSPRCPCPHSLLAKKTRQTAFSAAKDTGVSATCLGNIVHQAASVMGISLWQWSSRHKSKRAHKHYMTDGWVDSVGHRRWGMDGEWEIKVWSWHRGRRTEVQERSQSYEKSQLLDALWMLLSCVSCEWMNSE